MGGYGSGRPAGLGRDTVEPSLSLDVNYLSKTGYIGRRQAGLLAWERNGRRIGSINVRGEGDRIKLTYRSRNPGADWGDVIEYVEIERAPCRLGGYRPYFVCPGIVNGAPCRRRVVKLYGPGRYFLCRHCCHLAYASQNENANDRAMRRANKLRMRLGGEPGLEQPLPRRPKGMWRRTYERRIADVIVADEAADAAFMDQALRFFEQIGEPLTGDRRIG